MCGLCFGVFVSILDFAWVILPEPELLAQASFFEAVKCDRYQIATSSRMVKRELTFQRPRNSLSRLLVS